MKTKITLKIDAKLAEQARKIAETEGLPLSTWIEASLGTIIQKRSAYYRARNRALRRLKKGFALNWKPASSRQELHDR